MSAKVSLLGSKPQYANLAEVENRLGILFWEPHKVSTLVESLRTTYKLAVPQDLAKLPDVKSLSGRVEVLKAEYEALEPGDEGKRAKGQEYVQAQQAWMAARVAAARILGSFLEKAHDQVPEAYTERAAIKDFHWKAETYMRLYTAMSEAADAEAAAE